MLDALRKRCEFVDAAAERVGLANVRTLWMRAEDAGRDPTLREVPPPFFSQPLQTGHTLRCWWACTLVQ